MLNKLNSISKAVKVITAHKIFCISVQRTGTTSVGQFFKENNFRVATWRVSKKNEWTASWFKGDYERIFKSRDFKLNQVFEDDPWFCLDFYKVLFQRLPNAKFVLVERDADQWFNSMVSHSKGKTLGNTHVHATIYQRMNDFYSLKLNQVKNNISQVDNLLPLDESHREHYTKIYKLRNLEVIKYFELYGKNRIVRVKLEDKDKWQSIGAYFNINVDKDYDVHAR